MAEPTDVVELLIQDHRDLNRLLGDWTKRRARPRYKSSSAPSWPLLRGTKRPRRASFSRRSSG